MATWNLGGGSVKDTLLTLQQLQAHPELGKPTVWMLQEITFEESGLQSMRHQQWTILAHREETEWRGTGIAYHASTITRIQSPSTAIASAGVTAYTTTGAAIHLISCHLPHHATADRTRQLLQTWQQAHPRLKQHPCIIGADWNETFSTTTQGAATTRGVALLACGAGPPALVPVVGGAVVAPGLASLLVAPTWLL